jgi:hypothetical protein
MLRPLKICLRRVCISIYVFVFYYPCPPVQHQGMCSNFPTGVSSNKYRIHLVGPTRIQVCVSVSLASRLSMFVVFQYTYAGSCNNISCLTEISGITIRTHRTALGTVQHCAQGVSLTPERHSVHKHTVIQRRPQLPLRRAHLWCSVQAQRS